MKDNRVDYRVITSDSFQYSVEIQGYEDVLHIVDKFGENLLGSHDTHRVTVLVRPHQQESQWTLAAASLQAFKNQNQA